MLMFLNETIKVLKIWWLFVRKTGPLECCSFFEALETPENDRRKPGQMSRVLFPRIQYQRAGGPITFSLGFLSRCLLVDISLGLGMFGAKKRNIGDQRF